MRKIPLLFLLFFVYAFFPPDSAFSYSACCSSQGGIYFCNSNTGQLYCRNGTVSTECACQMNPSPTSTSTPTPTPMPSPTDIPAPSPTPPVCPAYSSYDAQPDECTCNSGYTVENNECVTDAQYCWGQFGGNSYFNTGNNSCECSQGYYWNSTTTGCISLNQLCINKLGNSSYYNTGNSSCYCYQGYSIQNGQCELAPTQKLSVSQPQNESVVSGVPVTIPTIGLVHLAPALTNNLPIRKRAASLPLRKSIPGLKGYAPVKSSDENVLSQIFASIWNFILHIFGK